MPEGVVGTISTYGCSLAVYYLSKKWPRLQCRTLVIVTVELIGMVACVFLYVLPQHVVGGRLACLWLAKFFLGPYIISLQLNVANIAGHTKKVTVQALIFIAYCSTYTLWYRLAFVERHANVSLSIEHYCAAILPGRTGAIVFAWHGRFIGRICWCNSDHLGVCGLLLL